MRHWLFLSVFVVTATSASLFGQDSAPDRVVGFGVRGGVPLTDPFETGSYSIPPGGESASSANRRYTVGPALELRLPHGFGVEVDALYQRLGMAETTAAQGWIVYRDIHISANSWEFPLLAKYRLPRIRSVHPYIAAGPSFRAVSGVSVSTLNYCAPGFCTATGPVHTSDDSHLGDRSHAGMVIGLGSHFRLGRIHIWPEGRYARWRADYMPDPYLYSNQNQVYLLMGITF